jgi:hypothetical protein
MSFVLSAKSDRPAPGARRARASELLRLALRQGGYFTGRQAQALGYVSNNHGHHVASGAWLREAHGLFRLADFPQDDPARAELHLWVLWTMGRSDVEPPGALAHETAMVVYGMSDLMLDKIHLFCAAGYRRRDNASQITQSTLGERMVTPR